MTFEVDSPRDDARNRATPGEPPPLMSRREARLLAEQERREEIAKTLELERIENEYRERVEEVARIEAIRQQRLEDETRFREQINNSQSLPVVTGADLEPTPVSAETLEATAVQIDFVSTEGIDSEEAPAVGKDKQRRQRVKREKVKRQKPARQKKLLRTRVARPFVVAVMAGLVFVMIMPATGFDETISDLSRKIRNQSLTVDKDAEQPSQVALSKYTVTNYSDTLNLEFGSFDFGYEVFNEGRIRWPFPTAVPISSGFGSRVAPCFSCSSYHEGLDFNPGEGTPFYAVADGVVTEVHDDVWGLGKWVVIEHDVKGLVFKSLYAHMIRDSTAVEVGQEVKVGQLIGQIGNSGTSTGPHLHFEIMLDDVPVDPFAWLKEHTKQ